MTWATEISEDAHSITIHIPLSFQKRGGRKLVLGPDGAAPARSLPHTDPAIVKAVTKAYRWNSMLESGDYLSIADLAKSEKGNQSYLCRILRLTLLAPDIVETILDGRQGRTLKLEYLLKPFPLEWDKQRQLFGCR